MTDKKNPGAGNAGARKESNSKPTRPRVTEDRTVITDADPLIVS